jgi:3-oxoacyl-[acyl-carrier-protein] synthase-3
MGTRIDAVATAHHRGRLLGRGALHLSDAAARTCLARGHVEPWELDILVNAGLYKDWNTAEPALASIIQEDIGANPGHPPRLGRHGTFSFDVLNGGCGVVTAAQLVDGFVGSGAARVGMIVASDVDPFPRTSRGFPFSPAGGALLLVHDGGDAGFQRFELKTFPEEAGLFEARLRWDPHAGLTRRGRNVLEVYEAPSFAVQCVERATEVAAGFLAAAGLRAADVDLLVGSQYPRGFAADVASRLGVAAGRVPAVGAALAAAHTAGPLAALEASVASGRFATARTTLFVTAGAGLTVGVALYRSAPGRQTAAC